MTPVCAAGAVMLPAAVQVGSVWDGASGVTSVSVGWMLLSHSPAVASRKPLLTLTAVGAFACQAPSAKLYVVVVVVSNRSTLPVSQSGAPSEVVFTTSGPLSQGWSPTGWSARAVPGGQVVTWVGHSACVASRKPLLCV